MTGKSPGSRVPSLLAKRTEKSRERKDPGAEAGESKRRAAEKGEVVDETTARTSSAQPDRVHLRFDRLG